MSVSLIRDPAYRIVRVLPGGRRRYEGNALTRRGAERVAVAMRMACHADILVEALGGAV